MHGFRAKNGHCLVTPTPINRTIKHGSVKQKQFLERKPLGVAREPRHLTPKRLAGIGDEFMTARDS